MYTCEISGNPTPPLLHRHKHIALWPEVCCRWAITWAICEMFVSKTPPAKCPAITCFVRWASKEEGTARNEVILLQLIFLSEKFLIWVVVVVVVWEPKSQFRPPAIEKSPLIYDMLCLIWECLGFITDKQINRQANTQMFNFICIGEKR